ncbi:ACT domain-containing protein [Herbivorax sp. ANBcel31]|uniref:ACT domain-containing protein n=1 Tax=Herbivorax sp. ANBcel31 TaxID=3069754 RepID=UPI0027B6D1DF|nr:ACT domain-containing protein [Herbivorax sp. ANBcel31]MDQ2086656.1 ACT domain-containing protein [Herbivorax sp. ANBcel31]
MHVKQISVFLENKSGRLAEVTKVLGENNIDISALSIADTTDFGILRLIVNEPEKAEKVLKESEFTVSSTSVIAIGVEDKPGGLSRALDILDAESIAIEYMYAFVGKKSDQALVILRVEDSSKAVDVLTQKDIKVLSADKVYKL